MGRTYAYHLLDVFTDLPFGGNGLAVFPDAEGLPAETMQGIARELNLSETVFVLPPQGDAFCRLRIFTPGVELPMAGHPTVGTASLLAHLGRVVAADTPQEIVFEEGVGPIRVIVHPDALIEMRQPAPVFGPIFEDRALLAAMLSLPESALMAGYPAQVVSTGVPFLYLPLRDLDAIGAIHLRMDLWEAHLKDYVTPHLFAFTMQTVSPQHQVHSRMFAPAMGISEDPATGAASGPLGAYLLHYGLHDGPALISEQGYEMGRPSLIHITAEREGDAFTLLSIAGRSVYMGAGHLHIPDAFLLDSSLTEN